MAAPTCFIHSPLKLRFLTVALLLLFAAAVRADWPDNNTNVAKWIEGPDRSANGYDVLAGAQPPGPNNPGALILADDFQCTQTGPITDIHLWTSWFGLNGSTNIPPLPITLSFWSDVPATNNPTNGQSTPSHPGALLWTETFTPGPGLGHYMARPWTSAREQFWDPDPAPQGVIFGPDTLIWQYNFYPSNAFVQQGGPNAPVVYWLSMTTGNSVQTSAVSAYMGWKTSTNQLLDNAVFGHLDAAGNPLMDWNELIAPSATGAKRSLDLSFVLTTPEIITNPPPPQNKWLQPPNLINGYDVAATTPFIAADDFLCTNASTITNIQVWGSWQNDIPSSNLTFVVSIWSDVPSTVPGGFSHPGQLLWSETFTPGNYGETFYNNGQEQFLIPPSQVSSESKVYLFSFNPQNPFCQQGSLRSPMVYWLSVSAINPSGNFANGGFFGWKTTTNHWRDDAVYGTVDSFGNSTGWHELFAPIVGAAPISLDLAFLLNNGPPSPDCDTTITTKWLQPPDRSTNGLDVLDTYPEILGDDFICHSPGPISGITIWGSWLNDQVDPNAVFQLGLWTDVPASAAGTTNFYSHPGQLLCSSTFYPPNAVGTSLQRYQFTNAIVNVHENFYNPDVGGTAGFIGTDSIIWRYDFYPFETPGECWIQRGLPAAPGLTYWISLSYQPTNGTQNLFGWKTSTTHNIDDAVFGHIGSSGSPVGDWKDLVDPRSGQSLDLSFALRNFPVTGINKDIRNTTGQPVTGIQLVVQGFHIITWHYDGAPPWPNFQVSYSGGDTVLQWTGQTIPVNGLTHVGFEMGASAFPTIVSINWMVGNTVIQPPIPQGNFHLLNGGTALTMVNDITPIPIVIQSIMTEFHSAPVALDQMVTDGNRTPIMTVAPQQPSGNVMPGLGALIPILPAPTNALYAMLQINLGDTNNNPTTTDFLLVPLDNALLPAVQTVAVQGSVVATTWTSVPGRTYNIQYTPSLSAINWGDSGLGDIVAQGAQTTSMIPINSTTAGFYRVVMLPQ